jgi:tetratricopeptide (TPR) repeat protein
MAACAFAALIGCPQVALGQRAAFLDGLAELTAAIEGTYGDEGGRVAPALDRMSRALDAWDRDITALEAEVASDTRTGPSRIDRRLVLGTVYAHRGRYADALREFEVVTQADTQRADAYLLRALVLRATDRTVEAGLAFRAGWLLDRSDPIRAYYVLQNASLEGDGTQARDAAESMAGAYRTILKNASGRKAAPFLRLSLVEEAADQPLLAPFAAYREAYARIVRGDFGGGIAEFKKAAATDPLVTDPASRSPSMLRAVAALRQGRLVDARMALEQSGAADSSSEAQRVLGLIGWVESDFNRSIRHLETAISRNPRDERSRLALSRVLSSAGRETDAERVLEETIRILPDSGRAQLWLASSYERVNRYADARHVLESALDKAVAGVGQIHGSLGRLASAAADLPAASDALTRAVLANPNDPSAHNYLAKALLQQDRTDEAFAEFIAVLLIDPSNADAHAGIGQIHLDAGRHAEAVEALRRASTLAPANIEVQYALASALTRAGRSEEATRYFSRVEQAQRQTLADRRRTLTLDVLREEAALRASEHDYDRAAALWEQVLVREPARASNHVGLGAVLASAGRTDQAIEHYEKAVTLGAEPAAYLPLADLYAKAGRSPDAARARLMYEKALQSDRTSVGPAR